MPSDDKGINNITNNSSVLNILTEWLSLQIDKEKKLREEETKRLQREAAISASNAKFLEIGRRERERKQKNCSHVNYMGSVAQTLIRGQGIGRGKYVYICQDCMRLFETPEEIADLARAGKLPDKEFVGGVLSY
ncbi:MAG: hypothetical protein V2G41_09635 [bacterium JZ-2024 1]